MMDFVFDASKSSLFDANKSLPCHRLELGYFILRGCLHQQSESHDESRNLSFDKKI